ncbi:hypothetical protein [Geomicrobium sp. JCM 19055]|uniref:hypothetical protein n=1 Tax=Geomicrobium sp. JCM 19055 TaxID=1460649 RepID=UPI00045ED2AB|nr:hypothetical protein [Geomicrobium sp. JCM 19055]GAJ98924.1 topoisomerase IV subunit A [Geomicrobium sp. JCM 19055]
MKKMYPLVGMTSVSMILAACATDEGTNDEQQDDPITESDEEVADADEPEDSSDHHQTAEEIIEAAIAAEEERQSFSMHSVMTMGIDASVDEDIPEEEDGEAEEREFVEYSYSHEDGTVSTRNETMVDGEPTEYTAGDSEYTLFYTEGDDVAYRVEQFEIEDDPADVNPMANQFEQFLEDYEVELVGEEEVNGFMSYHITFSDDVEVRHYWIEQETYEIVKMDNEHEDNPFRIGLDVLEFEESIDYDEAFFKLEDVLPEDVEIEDRDEDEHLEQELEDSLDDLDEDQ